MGYYIINISSSGLGFNAVKPTFMAYKEIKRSIEKFSIQVFQLLPR